MDVLSRQHRSWNMSRIRGRDTAPERAVRSMLRQMGFRISANRRGLPGTPDIVLARRKVAIFVHGCFWHRHSGCRFAYTPKSRVAFWTDKFRQNQQRDMLAVARLRRAGWRVWTIWECQAENPETLRRMLQYRMRRSKLRA